jgi:hypothetical protein
MTTPTPQLIETLQAMALECTNAAVAADSQSRMAQENAERSNLPQRERDASVKLASNKARDAAFFRLRMEALEAGARALRLGAGAT